MNELQPYHLDQAMFQEQPDQRKPLRQFIDDTVLPNAGMLVAPPMMAISALANIQRNPRLTEVPQ